MSIGSTIKKLRRERDMTQEQLAEYLGITANAVSQWECDRTAPDISQLPLLANLFCVSADVLLGIDVSSKDARIEEIYKEVRELWCTARREEAEQLCREGLRQFPDAYILMEELAWNLSYSDAPDRKAESIALFERIRAANVDENTKNFAIGALCNLYMQTGQIQTAKVLAESVPQLLYSRDDLLRMTLRGTEWAVHVRNQAYSCFDKFIWELVNLLRPFGEAHPLFNTEELLTLWQKVITFTEIFYENGDYAFNEQCILIAHYRRAKLYLSLGDLDRVLDELSALVAHIWHFDDYADGMLGNHIVLPADKRPTSLLVRPTDEQAEETRTVSSTSTENAAMEYLRQLSDKAFDPLREHPRFVRLTEELTQSAHA